MYYPPPLMGEDRGGGENGVTPSPRPLPPGERGNYFPGEQREFSITTLLILERGFSLLQERGHPFFKILGLVDLSVDFRILFQCFFERV